MFHELFIALNNITLTNFIPSFFFDFITNLVKGFFEFHFLYISVYSRIDLDYAICPNNPLAGIVEYI